MGAESLKNLLTGMAHREDHFDKSLWRSGILEVDNEISLPDENVRLHIFEIQMKKLKENSSLAPDVSLQELAARTKNYTGAEIEGVVKSAVSYTLSRLASLDDHMKHMDEESIKVTMDDFLNALQEIDPAFGVSRDQLERSRLYPMVSCGNPHEDTYKKTMLLVEQVKGSKGGSFFSCLLEGPRGSGKTALAATVGINSDFPYVKMVSAETMIKLHESAKCAQIEKVFKYAYISDFSIIILDDLERLLEYVANGPQFSNLIHQRLLVLLKQLPPKGKKLLVIGTTSAASSLKSIDITNAFSVTYHVPTLKDDAKKVLEQLKVFSEDDVDAAAAALNDMPIKKLFQLIEMATKGKHSEAAEANYSDGEKIKIACFYKCLQDFVRCKS